MKVWQFYRLVSYSFYTSYNLRKLQTLDINKLHITNYSIPKKNYWDQDYNYRLHNSPCVLWRQVLNTSDLVFRLLLGLLYIIWYFSLRHNRHFLVVVLNGGVFSIMDHSISYPLPLSFRSQMCLLKLDLVLHFGFSKSFKCSFHLVLKGL